MKNISQEYFNTYQLKMPLEISKIIEISDPVYTFSEVLNHIDLKKYLAKERCRRTGARGRQNDVCAPGMALFRRERISLSEKPSRQVQSLRQDRGALAMRRLHRLSAETGML